MEILKLPNVTSDVERDENFYMLLTGENHLERF